MTRLWLLRHAPTTWSAEKRLQGRNDLALSKDGRAVVGEWHLPEAAIGCNWYVSPLQRCLQTAGLLGIENAQIEPRLIEMDWGRWEGQTAGELKTAAPGELAEREADGLDMRPPGGESPRDVQNRVQPWLEERAKAGKEIAAITHKGVIRAIYALARGWDMARPPPEKLHWGSIHAFVLPATGVPEIDQLNIRLTAPR